MSFESINPATGKIINKYDEHTHEEVVLRLEKAHKAYQSWRSETFARRAKLLNAAADGLDGKKEKYARLMTDEMGKPIKEARAEAEKCASVCRFYAKNAEKFLADEPIATEASKSYVAYKPLGIVLAVMPWNFPFWQVFRFLAPALMAGNGAILKHASNVSGCALAIEDIINEAGFPKDIFHTLLVDPKEVAFIIGHPSVKAVTLTGSTRAGKAVAARAGECLKKTVLELGGSDPYIILEDADLDIAVETCVKSRMINGGQSCIAAKRFVVVDSIKKQFEDLFVAKMKQIKMGNPLEEDTQLGPQAREDLRDELHKQVQESIAKGAKLLLGGEIPETQGAYYPATILTDVVKGVPAYSEELFGPVASIIVAKNDQDAIEIANDSVFGLGAAIFSKNTKRAEQIAKDEIEAGACFANAFVRSHPSLPFGGIKESGYGRELASFGIREFVNIKTIYVA